MIKRKKKAVKFTDKKHSVRGIISLGLGIVACITFMLVSYLSSLTAGNGGIGYGFAGILLFALSIVGLVVSIKSFKEKDIYFNASIFGLVVHGFFVCLYFVLYIMGIGL